jgi:hypothetical protein
MIEVVIRETDREDKQRTSISTLSTTFKNPSFLETRHVSFTAGNTKSMEKLGKDM